MIVAPYLYLQTLEYNLLNLTKLPPKVGSLDK